MQLKRVGNPLSREERNKWNENLTLIEQEFTRVGQVKMDFDRVIADAGKNNPEVVQARGTEINLNARLDKTAKQLAETAKQVDMEVVRQQISNFLSLPPGSTTNDARLEDIKVGVDGTVYASPGDAVRKQLLNVEAFKKDISILVKSKNLLNPTDSGYVVGKYVAPTTGALMDNASYIGTGYMPVMPGDKIIITARVVANGVRGKYVAMRFVAAFDKSLNIKPESGNSADTFEYIVPAGVFYIRTSYLKRTDTDNIMIFKETTTNENPAFEPYFVPYYKTSVETDKTLSKENVPADSKTVGEMFENYNPDVEAYKNPTAIKRQANLAADALLTIDEFPQMLKAGQRVSYSAKIPALVAGNVIKVGFIKSLYATYQSWLEITPDRVKWLLSGTTATIDQAHGLTISDFVNVTININPATAKVEITLTSVNGTFKASHGADSSRLNAIGVLTAQANIATSNVVLSGTCTQFKYDTWLIGDSYFGDGPARIGGRLIEWGYASGVLFAGVGGLNSQDGYSELQRLLKYGTPKTLVWYLGMNDNATTVSTYFPLVEKLCDDNGIELIFNRIPFVPSRLAHNKAVHDYVLASERRYIDSCDAVGADANGNWYPGHIDPDLVHPAGLGGGTLTSRAIADVPEILSASIS